MSTTVALMTRRTIAADVKRVFEAWTRPEHLRAWWGPRPVRCSEAAVDLQVGGNYRIVNELPDGSHIVIEGKFTAIEPPTKLVYTWNVSPGPETTELITVRFEARGDTTEVIVVHEHIATQAQRDSHEKGWIGCFDGLASFFAR